VYQCAVEDSGRWGDGLGGQGGALEGHGEIRRETDGGHRLGLALLEQGVGTLI
jgi:hypothetical protein